MSLKSFFSDRNLTSDQVILTDELDRFFESSDRIFLMKGYAGTGKTFMIKGIAAYLCSVGTEVVLAAPTGRAAQILSEKTGKPASTIHRLLYGGLRLQDVATHAGEEYDINKVFFGLETNESAANTVYIIDESSMVSNAFQENDTMKFGSGFLLNDLITYVFPDPANTRRKIIFSGDPAQLPPVEMPFSPALDSVYLQENFRLSVSEFELRDVVRQEKHSKILKNATNLREALRLNRYGLPPLEEGEDVLFIQTASVVEQFVQRAGPDYDEAVVIAYSNRMVSRFNESIRKQIFPESPEAPVPGDRLVVVKNNYRFSKELLNGEIGTLITVNNHYIHEHKVNIRLPRKKISGEKKTDIVLRFREALLQFEDQNGSCNIECMILDNVLFSHRRDLSYAENVAMLVDFKNRFAQRSNRNVDFLTALKSDPFFNALRVKFGYALTGHKAQGGEWSDALVMCLANNSVNSTGYLRWLYTAITRAKKQLLLIEPPVYSQTRILQAAGKHNSTETTASSESDNKTDRMQEFADNLTVDVRTILSGLNFAISHFEAITFGIQLTIEKDGNKALLRLFYNSRNKITRLDILNSCGIEPEDLKQLTDYANLTEKKISIRYKNTSSGRPGNRESVSNGFIEEFKAKIVRIITPCGIKLVKTTAHPYHEIFYFEKNLKYAVIKFHYNK